MPEPEAEHGDRGTAVFMTALGFLFLFLLFKLTNGQKHDPCFKIKGILDSVFLVQKYLQSSHDQSVRSLLSPNKCLAWPPSGSGTIERNIDSSN